MRRGVGYGSGVQAVLKVTPENGVSVALLQWCGHFGASGDACLEMEQNLGDPEQPQRCLPSALRGSAPTPSKEKSRGRCIPNPAFCVGPRKGSPSCPRNSHEVL